MNMVNDVASSTTLRDLVRPQFHQVILSIEPYIKSDLGIKLDKGQFRLSL